MPTTANFEPDPLEKNTWTQHEFELDQLVGQVTVKLPATSKCSATTKSTVAVQILLGGKVVGGTFASDKPTAVTETLPLTWPNPSPTSFEQLPRTEEPEGLTGSSGWLYERGGNPTRTITAQIADDCGAGGNSTEHPTIESISIDVLGVS